MTINRHYNSHRIDWTKTQAAPGSTRTDGVSRTSGRGGDMPVNVVEGEGTRLTTVGGKVTLETPNGVLEFGTGMDALESLKDFLGEIDGLNQLDEKSINMLSRYLGEMKKEYASANSAILDMIELMQLMVEMHQKERETLSLMRQGEGVRARAELQQKANLTRAGATQNFAMTMAGSAISLAFAGFSLKSSISSLKSMSRTMNDTFGLEQMELSAASNLTDSRTAQSQARNMEVKLAMMEDSSFRLEKPKTPTTPGTPEDTVGETAGKTTEETTGENRVEEKQVEEKQLEEKQVEGRQAEEKQAEVAEQERKMPEPDLPSQKEVEESGSQSADDDFNLLKDDAPPGPEPGNASEPSEPSVEKPTGSDELKPAAVPEEGETPDTPDGVTDEPEVADIGRMPNGKGAERVMQVDRKTFSTTRDLLFDKNGNFRICDSNGNELSPDKLPLRPGISPADLKDVKTVRQAMDALDLKPKSGDKAGNQFKTELKGKLSAAMKADYLTARGKYTRLLHNIDSIEGAIESKTFQDFGYKDASSAKKALAGLRAEAVGLKAELRYVKAVEVSGQSKCMGAKGIADEQDRLQGNLESAKHKCINSCRYKTLENKLQMAGSWSGLGSAIKEIFAGIGNFLQAEREAEATEAETEHSRRQEEMDTLKELIGKNDESLQGLAKLMEAALMSGTDTRATVA